MSNQELKLIISKKGMMCLDHTPNQRNFIVGLVQYGIISGLE